MKVANYKIRLLDPTKVVLGDEGPHDKYPTITNSIEDIIKQLVDTNVVNGRRRVFYWDSDQKFTEVILKGTEFAGFQEADAAILV